MKNAFVLLISQYKDDHMITVGVHSRAATFATFESSIVSFVLELWGQMRSVQYSFVFNGLLLNLEISISQKIHILNCLYHMSSIKFTHMATDILNLYCQN